MENQEVSFEQWLINHDDLIKYFTYETCKSLDIKAEFLGYFSIDAYSTYNGGDAPRFKTITHIRTRGNFDELICYFRLVDYLHDDILKVRIYNTPSIPLLAFSLAEIREKQHQLSNLTISDEDFTGLRELLTEFKVRRNR